MYALISFNKILWLLAFTKLSWHSTETVQVTPLRTLASFP